MSSVFGELYREKKMTPYVTWCVFSYLSVQVRPKKGRKGFERLKMRFIKSAQFGVSFYHLEINLEDCNEGNCL